MTKDQFKEWLKQNYGRGGRAAFVNDFNGVAASVGVPLITPGAAGKPAPALNTWVTRNPPQQYGGFGFERFLALVKARKEATIQVAKVYSLAVPADIRTVAALEGISAEDGVAVEAFLLTTLLAQLEEEVALWESSQKPKRKK